MNKKDYQNIAQAIKNFIKKVKEEENTGSDFDEFQFLVDEFAYQLEENKNFNEKKFRQFIFDL